MNSNFELVFVHLGTAKAPHLWANIESVQKNWPEITITLLSDTKINLERARKMGVGTFEFKVSTELENVMVTSRHNSTFRQGFWNYSILRLFAVLEYSAYKSNTALIHIESDIVIMPNFPFEKLAKLDKPSWMKFNETHDVGSIFTIPNGMHSEVMYMSLLEMFSDNGSLTDMTLLSKFAATYPDSMTYLPVAGSPTDITLRIDVRESIEGSKTASNFDLFGGVFDSAPLGMWLLGQDPRNHLGRVFRYRRLPESFVQAQLVGFEFDTKLRTLSTGSMYPIFNLHVHSKHLKYFSDRGWKAIEHRVAESKTGRGTTSFSIRAFFQLGIDFYQRNGILSIPKKITSLIKTWI